LTSVSFFAHPSNSSLLEIPHIPYYVIFLATFLFVKKM
jgi:hypothetical protein